MVDDTATKEIALKYSRAITLLDNTSYRVFVECPDDNILLEQSKQKILDAIKEYQAYLLYSARMDGTITEIL